MNSSKIFVIYILFINFLKSFAKRRFDDTTLNHSFGDITLLQVVERETGVECVIRIRRNHQEVTYMVGTFGRHTDCVGLIHKQFSTEKTQSIQTRNKRSSERLEALLGSELSLRCLGKRTSSEAKVLWYKNEATSEMQVKKLSNLRVNGRGNTLTFLSLTTDDVGTYSCRRSDHSLPSKTFNVKALQCSVNEVACDDSTCFNNGVCCENPVHGTWRCICFSTMTSRRCNKKQVVYSVSGGSNGDVDQAGTERTLLLGLSCLFLLCIALVIGIICLSKKENGDFSRRGSKSFTGSLTDI